MAHILLAEDDESLRKFLAAALVKAGHVVTDFGDGAEAWDCVQGMTFDLLLTDIVMPGMDGIELVQKVRERKIHCRIMVFCSALSRDVHDAYRRLSVDRMLYKPVMPAELRTAIREIFAEKK